MDSFAIRWTGLSCPLRLTTVSRISERPNDKAKSRCISSQRSLNKSLIKRFTGLYTAGLQRHNTEYSKQIFPEKDLRASVPISTFMCLRAIYIYPRLVCLFCRKICGPILWIQYINRSQRHECGNWNWGRTLPVLGIQKWDFRHSAEENGIDNQLIWRELILIVFRARCVNPCPVWFMAGTGSIFAVTSALNPGRTFWKGTDREVFLSTLAGEWDR